MKKIIILAFYIFLSNYLYSQWISVGPYGERVNCIYKNGNNLYLCMGSGLYLSANDGYSWNKISNDTLQPQAIAVTISGTNLIASSLNSNGLRLSTNNGMNWTIIPNSPSYTSKFLKKGNTLFSWYNGGVLTSENDGYNWVLKGSVPWGFSYGWPLATFDTLGSYLIAGTCDSGVFISSNNGVNWIAKNNGLTNKQIRSLSVGGQNIYAGTNYGGIFKSSDYGASWFNIGFGGEYVSSILVSGINIFVGVERKGIYMSSNNGTSWIPMNNGCGNTGINTLYQYGSNIYAGTSTNGIFISSNNGASWRNANSNSFYTKHIYCLTSQGSNIYAGGDGIFISSNNGLNWNASNIGLGEQQVWSITFSNNKMYIGTNYNGVYLSTNYGQSWSNIGLQSNWITALIVSGQNIVAGEYGDGLYYSSNEGVNWIKAYDSAFVNTIIKYGTNIYAGTDDDGILMSSNDGVSWSKIANIWGINAMTFSGSFIYAADAGGRVYRSSNSGYNWTYAQIDTGYTGQIWSIASSGSNVIASCYSKVYVSTNYGENWILRNQGINPNSYRMYATIIANNYVLAGNDGSGVWRRPLSEVIGINNINSSVPGDYYLYQNYPNPFNPKTTIKFQIKEQGFVTLKVYDILGKEVATLLKKEFQSGIYEMAFSINQFSNNAFSSGIYFYRIEVTDLLEPKIKFIETKKMVLIK